MLNVSEHCLMCLFNNGVKVKENFDTIPHILSKRDFDSLCQESIIIIDPKINL